MQLYHGWPLSVTNKVPILTTFEIFSPDNNQPDEIFVRVCVPAEGVFVLRVNSDSQAGMDLIHVGQLNHNTSLDSDWTFCVPYPQNTSQMTHKSLDMIFRFQGKNCHLYYGDHQLKSIAWERSQEGSYIPQICHVGSDLELQDYQIFTLDAPNPSHQILVGLHNVEGFFLLESQPSSTGMGYVFVKKNLKKLNEHPYVQKILSSQMEQDKHSSSFVLACEDTPNMRNQFQDFAPEKCTKLFLMETIETPEKKLSLRTRLQVQFLANGQVNLSEKPVEIAEPVIPDVTVERVLQSFAQYMTQNVENSGVLLQQAARAFFCLNEENNQLFFP